MKEKQIIGNIFGSIAALIGLWRFFAAVDASSLMNSGLRAFDVYGMVQGKIDSLYIQGFLFMAIGAAILIWANFKSSNLDKYRTKEESSKLVDQEKEDDLRGEIWEQYRLDGKSPKDKSPKDDKWVDPYGV